MYMIWADPAYLSVDRSELFPKSSELFPQSSELFLKELVKLIANVRLTLYDAHVCIYSNYIMMLRLCERFWNHTFVFPEGASYVLHLQWFQSI